VFYFLIAMKSIDIVYGLIYNVRTQRVQLNVDNSQPEITPCLDSRQALLWRGFESQREAEVGAGK
jgi:hypothetical protein